MTGEAHGHPHGHVHPFDAEAPGRPGSGRTIADGVVELDTLLGGWDRVTAGYLIEGPEPVLVETGSQSSVPVLLAHLDALGLGPDDLAGVVVTHIHLDHAGGVGDVARAFPKATVYVHPKGARHLADPTRLVDSAAGSTDRCSTRCTGGSTPPLPSASTCWRTGRPSGWDLAGRWWRLTHRDTPSTTWPSTTR